MRKWIPFRSFLQPEQLEMAGFQDEAPVRLFSCDPIQNSCEIIREYPDVFEHHHIAQIFLASYCASRACFMISISVYAFFFICEIKYLCNNLFDYICYKYILMQNDF